MATAPTPRNKVFISYSRQDKKWLARLQVYLKPLEREGRLERWDDTRIRAGAHWREEIERALAEAKVAVLLISANFLASDFIAENELPPLLAWAEEAGVEILPVIVSPSRFEKTESLAQFEAVNDPKRPLSTLPKPKREEEWVRVVEVIEESLQGPPGPATAYSPGLLAFPARNRFFTGRDSLLSTLYDALEAGPIALTGLGGLGKSQAAIEYAYRQETAYATRLWLRADSRESLISSCVTLAQALNLPQKAAQEEAEIVAAVQRWLQRQSRWLLVLDNAEDLALVRDFLPPNLPSGGLRHVLLTRRDETTGAVARALPLAHLPTAEGALFLLRRAKALAETTPLEAAPAPVRAAAEALGDTLGGLPLALDQAAAFMEEQQIGPDEYQALYQEEGKTLREQRGTLTDDHPSVTVTFRLAFEQVAAASPAAADLLRLCAFLHLEGIPEELLTEGAAELGEPLGPTVTGRLGLINTRGEALRYGLLSRDPPTQTLTMHRVVQAVLKDAMDEATQRLWAERAVRALARGFPGVEFATWPQCERWLPQALAGAEWIVHGDFRFAEAAGLLNQAGVYLHERGRYWEAEPLYQRALVIREQALGPDHPHTAASLNNLAELYRAQGCYPEAEPLYQRALVILEQALGPDHPDTAQSLNNLAVLYDDQERYPEAEPLHQRALAIREQTLGPDHPRTAISLNNLAALYQAQGRYPEAEPLYQRALAIVEQAFGPDHPHTQTVRNNYERLLAALQPPSAPEGPK
jgi:tetratricopeptide (TPR) repeat protein